MQNVSDESTASALRADVELTNHLSALLDHQRNETVKQALNISGISSPEDILAKVLTFKPNISTASFLSNHQPGQQFNTSNHRNVGYRTLGFGQCGLVFERPGGSYVLKIAKSSYEDTLWADFVAHFNVRRAFEQQEPECRVPQVFYVSRDNHEWWNANLPLFTEVHKPFSLPAMTFITERILPFPKVAREALINKYCPAAYRPVVAANPTNRDSLVRVYLGRRRLADEPPPPNFTLRNYNLCLDQMLDLGLPVKILAADMG